MQCFPGRHIYSGDPKLIQTTHLGASKPPHRVHFGGSLSIRRVFIVLDFLGVRPVESRIVCDRDRCAAGAGTQHRLGTALITRFRVGMPPARDVRSSADSLARLLATSVCPTGGVVEKSLLGYARSDECK